MTSVLPAVSFEDVLRRAPAWGDSDNPTAARLVSVVFADPASAAWRELQTNRAFLDERSGDAWDLFFAGMSGYQPMEADAFELPDRLWHEQWSRYMNPRYFRDLEHRISMEHDNALRMAHRNEPPWRYSGGTDLVSFMAYAQEPDFLSLKAVRLDPHDESSAEVRLASVTEKLRRWYDDDVDERFAPGSVSQPDLAMSLVDGLRFSATAVASGVLGDAAFELVKQILHH